MESDEQRCLLEAVARLACYKQTRKDAPFELIKTYLSNRISSNVTLHARIAQKFQECAKLATSIKSHEDRVYHTSLIHLARLVLKARPKKAIREPPKETVRAKLEVLDTNYRSLIDSSTVWEKESSMPAHIQEQYSLLDATTLRRIRILAKISAQSERDADDKIAVASFIFKIKKKCAMEIAWYALGCVAAKMGAAHASHLDASRSLYAAAKRNMLLERRNAFYNAVLTLGRGLRDQGDAKTGKKDSPPTNDEICLFCRRNADEATRRMKYLYEDIVIS